MFRRAVSRLALFFPPKFVADRLLPWATTILAITAALWAIHQYQNDIAISRVQNTLDLHKRYTENFLTLKSKIYQALRPTVLQASCEFVVEHEGKKSNFDPSLSEILCSSLDDEAKLILRGYNYTGELREERRKFVFSKVSDHPLKRNDIENISQLYTFFRSIVVCVERRNCDRQTSVALFSREMVEFLNATCAFDEKLNSGGSTGSAYLANFLVEEGVHQNIYWSLDPKREKLFACDGLRKMEN